jgi:multisubunit Na+/H+ antiporter MnhF subunit
MKENWIIIVLLISFVIGYVLIVGVNKWKKRPLIVSMYGFISTIMMTYIISYYSSNRKLDYKFVIFIIVSTIFWVCFYKYIKKDIKDYNELKEDIEKIKEKINKL